jgi:hypothetical protein
MTARLHGMNLSPHRMAVRLGEIAGLAARRGTPVENPYTLEPAATLWRLACERVRAHGPSKSAVSRESVSPLRRADWSEAELEAAQMLAAHGVASPDIGAALGRSDLAVRGRLHRARRTVAESAA